MSQNLTVVSPDPLARDLFTRIVCAVTFMTTLRTKLYNYTKYNTYSVKNSMPTMYIPAIRTELYCYHSF